MSVQTHNQKFIDKKNPTSSEVGFFVFYEDYRIRFRIILDVFFRITTFRQQHLRLMKRWLHA